MTAAEADPPAVGEAELPTDPPTGRERAIRLGLYLAWAILVAWLAADHVFWRDEVRAFTIALRGDSVGAMLRGLQGEGHPALWYLMLRGAHAIVPVRAVLPVVAALVAAAAMALLVFRAPFRPGLIALILFGAMGLIEYAVSARNYGISMLILFALAHFYPRHRDRGVLLGLLLALLCNTNVPAALLAAAFLLFWLIELIGEDGLRWTKRTRIFLVNSLLAALGALVCFVTIYPPANDAAILSHGQLSAGDILGALLIPGAWFPDLAPKLVAWSPWLFAGLSLVIVGSLFGLARAPAAFISSLVVLIVFEAFYFLIYRGGYRHQALLIVYLVTMYWLVANGRGGRWPERIAARIGATTRAGTSLFVVLLAFQVANAMVLVAAQAQGVPAGRARDLARLLARDRLGDAILVADPDGMLEAMPYYVRNPIYLLREQRFGNVVRFTSASRVDLSLDEMLASARGLHARTGRPVAIILQHRLDPAAPPARIPESYRDSFTTSPDQVRRFQAATRWIGGFGRAISDESYDVYLLGSAAPLAAPVREGSAPNP